ncbi:NAD-dependent epimerase [Photobacterium sp. CCB-ST2H9]|uniref:NAD-dependent epimerase n=1 Tax=Photobacterium sp. CCB-ST2H9 TaxID=2912855 RepID=UPI0020060437|nr:NAD-dependent epimerase [Photobacterium sp. CCB-ST2H9]UTM57494.1 NAD-dependent epimerase [Photobacterium sp. CCB-ST2H9]
MRYLVTGVAGFIGSAVAQRLCSLGHEVVGIDNFNSYYDVKLKQARVQRITHPALLVLDCDLADREAIARLFLAHQFDRVIHLAAQAGVRYSLDNPMTYADSNLTGHLTILEGCRRHQIEHLVYASSSSVYGLNRKLPLSTDDSVDHPVSLYAATKKANELMAHTYSHLYGIPTTGLRFFTVYGPWGRPDMALFMFTEAMLASQPIDIYNQGDMLRDFTYIDDIVEGVVRIQDVIPTSQPDWLVETGSPATSSAPYCVYNLGHGQPVKLMDFIAALEKALGREAIKNYMPMQPGDVYATYAETEDLFAVTGFRPQVSVEAGVQRFVDWYLDYYGQSAQGKIAAH